MAAQADLVINNGEAVPVAKTFKARGADTKLATWKDTTAGMNIGYPTITASLKETGGSDGKCVVDFRTSLPVLEVISGADGGYTPSPRIAYTLWGTTSFTLPNRSTNAERKNIRAFQANLLDSTMALSLVNDLERPF